MARRRDSTLARREWKASCALVVGRFAAGAGTRSAARLLLSVFIAVYYRPVSLATDGLEIQNQVSVKKLAEGNEKQDALCVLDRNCRYVYVNQAMADLHGISRESHEGKCVSEVVPRMTEIVTFAVREVLRTQAPLVLSVIGQLLPTSSDTTRHWVACYLPVSDGTEVAVVATEIEHSSKATGKTLVVACAWCRRIRNPEGAWVDIASFPALEHATLTHGICKDCAEKEIS
jgi:PAS domain S-box-containing protein